MKKYLLCVAMALSAACVELPPIVIAPPVPSDPPPVVEPAKPRATLAFLITDADTGAPIQTAFAIFDDGVSKQADDRGYIARELEAGGAVYAVKFEADDYGPILRRFQLGSDPAEVDGAGNRQFPVTLQSTKPKPEPPAPAPEPVPVPPVVTPPPVAVSPLEEAAGWSDEQWRAYLIPLLKRNGELVNDASMKIVRPDVTARGADFQNGWRGDLRPRVFLPVAGCPSSAIQPDALPCAYNRTVDLGQYGQPWEWIKR